MRKPTRPLARRIDERQPVPYQQRSPEPVFCTENERCRGCPYPAHGVICWHRDGGCLRTDKLNFYVQADFDVDAAFGTFVCTDENNDWLNIYANYDIAQDRPCDTLELNLCKGDGTEENWSYHLNAAEQEVLARKMEAFCQQQNGMSLCDFARQLQEEPGPSPQIQM